MVRALKQREALTLIAVAATLVTVAAIKYVPYLTVVERFFSDFRIATLLPPEPQDPDIVIAAITEDTLRLFPYRSPVDRKFLADLVDTLNQRGAKAILLDVLLDQPTEPVKDDALKTSLRALKIPIEVSYVRDPETVTPQQLAYLDNFVPGEDRGLANLVTDSYDDVVRRIFRGAYGPSGKFDYAVAVALAKKLGVEPPPTRIPIVWHGAPNAATKPFREFPAQTIKFLPPAWIKDKVVLIGADETLVDRHRTPFAAAAGGSAGMLPGIVIQAHILSQLLHGRPLPDVPWYGLWLLTFMMSAAGVALGRLDIAIPLRLGLAIGTVLAFYLFGFTIWRYGGLMIPLVTPSLGLIVAHGITDAYTGRQLRQQKRFVKQAFSRYVTPHLVDQLVADPTKLSLTGERRELSLLFTDVAGFTTLSERLDPHVMTTLLNEYLGGVCDAIDRHAGTVNKFIGDAVFAIFGAPLSQPDHAERALACMREIDAFSEAFRAAKRVDGIDFGVTRIGAHAGRAMIGNFGSLNRFDYTALGDAVNTASRLEGLNKYFGTRMCVSGALHDLCGAAPFRPMGNIILKGKTEGIAVFEPLTAEQSATPFMRHYCQAFELLSRGDPGAEQAFSALSEEQPEDGCVALHLERIREGAHDTNIVMSEK
jgi:adenylate cyclase